MNNNRYITESVSNIRDLMGRMGENLIVENALEVSDDNMTSSAKPIEGLEDDIEVIINTQRGQVARMNQDIYINYDVTEIFNKFGKDALVNVYSSILNDYRQNGCKFNAKANELKFEKMSSGDVHLTHTIRRLNSAELMKAHSMYSTMYAVSGGKINMTWNDILSQINISGQIKLLDTKSKSGQNVLMGFLKKAGELWSNAKNAVKGMLGKKPIVTDSEGKQVAIALDPRVRFGHQLSGLNQAMIIAEAEAYGVPTPRFVCKAEMITGKRPWGFERKFKEGITIHPYYIRYVNHRKASMSSLMKIFTNPSDQEMIKRNPQMANELAIANGDHGAQINGSQVFFGWSLYYDIDETEPVNPEDDVFENTIGSSDNLQHTANEYTQKLQNELNAKEGKPSSYVEDDADSTSGSEEIPMDGVMPSENGPEQIAKPTMTPLMEKVKLMVDIANEMDFPEAYNEVGYRKATDDETVYKRLEWIVRNLCCCVIAEKINAESIQACLPYAAYSTKMVLDALGIKHKVEHSTQPNEVSISTAEEIISRIKSKSGNYGDAGLVGESLIGKCLASVLMG